MLPEPVMRTSQGSAAPTSASSATPMSGLRSRAGASRSFRVEGSHPRGGPLKSDAAAARLAVAAARAVVGAGARFAYPLEEKEYDGDMLEQFAMNFVADGSRKFVGGTLEESEVTNVVVDIYNTLPGGALGMLPGDFSYAFEVLDERIKIDNENDE